VSVKLTGLGAFNGLCRTTVSMKLTGLGAFNGLCRTTVSVKPTHLAKPRKFGAAAVIEAGYAVARFVETLRYKPEVRGLDSQWGH